MFPQNDKLLHALSTEPDQWPFEKHLPGFHSPYESLPNGGWITGNAAARRGIDLRLFYKEPPSGSEEGQVLGAVRFGDGASIGSGFFLPAHGGAVSSKWYHSVRLRLTDVKCLLQLSCVHSRLCNTLFCRLKQSWMKQPRSSQRYSDV